MYLQLPQANVIQTLQMAEAFSESIDTTLLANRTRQDYRSQAKSIAEIMADLGFQQNFKFVHFHNLLYFVPGSEQLRIKYLLKRASIFLQRYKFDYVFTRQEEFAVGICRKCPAILELHDINHVYDLPGLINCMASFPLRVVAISQGLKNILVEAGMDGSKIAVLHDGVNLKHFQAPELKPMFTAEKPIVGYAGHLYKDRGIELIMEAARVNPHFEFVVAGGFPKDVAYYRALSREKKIGNIRFLGMLPYKDIPAFLEKLRLI